MTITQNRRMHKTMHVSLRRNMHQNNKHRCWEDLPNAAGAPTQSAVYSQETSLLNVALTKKQTETGD